MTIDKVVLLGSLLPHTLRRGGAASHRINRAPARRPRGPAAIRAPPVMGTAVVSDPFLWEPGSFCNNDNSVTRGRRGLQRGANYLLSAN
jgi:hypothetical protein